MPLYEYACTSCGQEWETHQAISEEAINTCPLCGSTAKRLISQGGSFVLKGEGWAKDNYSTGKKK